MAKRGKTAQPGSRTGRKKLGEQMKPAALGSTRCLGGCCVLSVIQVASVSPQHWKTISSIALEQDKINLRSTVLLSFLVLGEKKII